MFPILGLEAAFILTYTVVLLITPALCVIVTELPNPELGLVDT